MTIIVVLCTCIVTMTNLATLVVITKCCSLYYRIKIIVVYGIKIEIKLLSLNYRKLLVTELK